MTSVIIPTYNGADLIAKSLPCWFSQTIPENEYEVFVVDNRSTDNTRTTVEKLIDGRPSFHYLYEETPGATAARHAGVRASHGDILLFADNDVYVKPEAIAAVLKVYNGHTECVAVTGRIELLWDKEEPEWITPYRYLLGELNYGEAICYGKNFYLNGGFMSVRRDVFERLHGFNPDLIGRHLIGDGDTGFVKKLFKEGLLIGYTPFATVQHNQQVEKHGSVDGIALHFYNNGIADSYAVYREAGFHCNLSVVRHFLKEVAICIKQGLKRNLLERTNRHLYFTLRQHQGRLHFFSLLVKPELRREIRVMNVYDTH